MTIETSLSIIVVAHRTYYSFSFYIFQQIVVLLIVCSGIYQFLILLLMSASMILNVLAFLVDL